MQRPSIQQFTSYQSTQFAETFAYCVSVITSKNPEHPDPEVWQNPIIGTLREGE